MKIQKNRKDRRRSGFSLMELMLVLVIIGIIAGIGTPMYLSIRDSSNVKAAKASVLELEKAITSYNLDHNQLPNSLQDLYQQPSSVETAGNWPYFKKSKLKDPWGRELKYEASPSTDGTPFKVWSEGPPNKNQKIGNWDDSEQ